METDLYTLGVLGIVLLCGWLVANANPWTGSDLAQELRLQLARATDAIRGATHTHHR